MSVPYVPHQTMIDDEIQCIQEDLIIVGVHTVNKLHFPSSNQTKAEIELTPTLIYHAFAGVQSLL